MNLFNRRFHVGQFVKEPVSKKTTSIDFLWQNSILLYINLLGYIFTILFLVLFFVIDFKFNLIRIKNYLFASLIRNESNRMKDKLIWIFFSFFLFFSTTILINSIKTDSVIFDTKDIIYNLPQLLGTDKIACWFRGEQG